MSDTESTATSNFRETSSRSRPTEGGAGARAGAVLIPPTFLFEKKINPSDCGYSFYIPKKSAETHFPAVIRREGKVDQEAVELPFVDFRNVDWRMTLVKASGRYRLSTGWSQYLSLNGLRGGDVIRFYKRAGPSGVHPQYIIDFVRQPGN